MTLPTARHSTRALRSIFAGKNASIPYFPETSFSSVLLYLFSTTCTTTSGDVDDLAVTVPSTPSFLNTQRFWTIPCNAGVRMYSPSSAWSPPPMSPSKAPESCQPSAGERGCSSATATILSRGLYSNARKSCASTHRQALVSASLSLTMPVLLKMFSALVRRFPVRLCLRAEDARLLPPPAFPLAVATTSPSYSTISSGYSRMRSSRANHSSMLPSSGSPFHRTLY